MAKELIFEIREKHGLRTASNKDNSITLTVKQQRAGSQTLILWFQNPEAVRRVIAALQTEVD